MDTKTFQSLLAMADTFQRVDQNRADFWRGFQRGIRRAYHGKNFGTVEQHEQYMNCRDGDYRSDLQTGYRAGFYRDQLKIDGPDDVQPIRIKLRLSVAELARIAAVSPRTVEGWEQGRPIAEPCVQLIRKYLMI